MAVSQNDRDAMNRQIAVLKQIEEVEQNVAEGSFLREILDFINPLRVKSGLNPFPVEPPDNRIPQ